MSFFDLVNQDPVANLFGGTLYEAKKPLQSEFEPVSEVGSLLAGTPLSKAAIDSERYTDKLKIELANADKARGLTMVDMPVTDKLTQITQLQQPVVERGVGDIYSDRNFQGLDPVSKDEVASSVNYAYEQENATKAFMHSLGAEDYDVYKSPEDILSLPVPVNLLAGASDLEVSKLAGSKGKLMQEEMLKKDFIKINEARRLKGKPPLKLPDDVRKLTVTERLNFTSTGDIPESTEELLNEIIPLDSKNVGTTQVGTQSIKDFLYYSSAYPVNKDVEIEFGNILAQAAGDPEFDIADAIETLDTQINARYGDESYKMMAALMAREGLEWMAVAKLLKGTGVVKDNSSWAYTTFMNNAVFATVGTEIDRAIDKVFNKESADRLTEYGVRFLGGFVGESAAKVVGTSIRSALKIKPKPKPPIQAINDVAQTTGQTKAAVDVNNRVLNDVLNPPAGADGLPTNTTSSIVGVPRELVETEVLSNGAVSGVDNALGDAAIIRANQEVFPVSVKVKNGKSEEIKLIFQHIDDNVTNLPLIKEETAGLPTKQSQFQALRYKDAVVNQISDPIFNVGKNVVRNLGVTENTIGVVREQLSKTIKVAFKGLNKRQIDGVYDTLLKGDDLGKVFDTDELYKMGLSKAQIESYGAVRTSLDETAKVLDGYYVKSYKDNGVKAHKNDFVKVVGKGEPDEKGMVLVYPKDKTAADAVKVPMGELEEVTTVLRSREGYFPIVYDAKFAISELDKKTGKFSRVHAAKTTKEAKQKLAEFEGNRESDDKMYFMHRWDSSRGALDLGLADRTQKLMDALDPTTFEGIKKSLQDAGIDAESLTYSYDLAHPSAGMTKSVGLGARGSKRIGDRLPPADALANYYSRVANATVYDQWRVDAIKKLDADAAKYLVGSGAYNKNAALGKRVDPSKATPATQRIADQLKRTEDFVAYALGGRSALEKELDNRAAALIDDLSKTDSKALNVVGDSMRDIGLDRAMSNAKRATLATGYYTRLWANLNALLPQLAQFIPTTGAMGAKSPKAFLKTAYDAMDLLVSTSNSKVTGRPVSKNAQAIIKEFEQSGWLNAKDFTDISDVMTQTDMGTGRSVMRNVSSIGAAPIQIPEKLVRFYGYMFARNDMLAELKAGKLNGFNGKFKGKVGGLEWRNLVVDRAKAYTLDYSKTGKIGVNRGVGAIGAQFVQFAFKQFAQMTYDSRLPLRARLGAYGATAAAFGTTNAMPFMGDAVNLADWLATSDNAKVTSTDNPVDLEPVSNAMKVAATAYRTEIKEALNSAGFDGNKVDKVLRAYTGGQGAFDLFTDEELVVFHRVTAANFMSDLVNNWYDMGDSIDPSRFSVGIFSLATIMASSKNIYDAYVTYAEAQDLSARIDSGQEPDLEQYSKEAVESTMFWRKVAGEVGKSWSAVGSQVRYWANANKPYGSNIETLGGNTYPVGTDETAIKGLLFGAMPADMYYAFRDSRDSKKRGVILQDTMYAIAKGYEEDVLKMGYSSTSAQAAEYIKKAVLKVRIMETYLNDVVHDKKALEASFGGVGTKWSLLPDKQYRKGGLEKQLMGRIMNINIKSINKLPSNLPNPTSNVDIEGVKELDRQKQQLEQMNTKE